MGVAVILLTEDRPSPERVRPRGEAAQHRSAPWGHGRRQRARIVLAAGEIGRRRPGPCDRRESRKSGSHRVPPLGRSREPDGNGGAIAGRHRAGRSQRLELRRSRFSSPAGASWSCGTTCRTG